MQEYHMKDLEILAHLRQDSRMNLTKISRHTSTPISTIFDKLKKYHGNLIIKNTVLIDFRKLGYELKVNMLLKIDQQKRAELKTFLEKNWNINNIYRINNGYDFLIETIFKNIQEMEEFNDQLEKLGVNSKQEFFILEDIKKEEFISQPNIIEMMHI